MLSRLNLKLFYIIGYPTIFGFSIQGIFKYLRPNFYFLIGGLILGAGIVMWWKWAKPFLFALEIKIEFKNENK
jgi:hypothetical protein